MNSFQAKGQLAVGKTSYEIFRLETLENQFPVHRLPFSHKILLENLLRHEDGVSVTAENIRTLAMWDPKAEPDKEIAFMPARVLMQDFTGVPAVVDLAAMREAVKKAGGDPSRINPLLPVELVIDHSVQVDTFGRPDALKVNSQLEFERNKERYLFLRWGQNSLKNFKAVPPDTGIVHQVNIEFLARVVFPQKTANGWRAYPDTLVGTDSHTTMVNGLGVLGWGVGGIEAEAAMLGQPVSMLIPQVVGFKLNGRLAEGATATDLVLTVTQMLRKKGVVGKFVEFFGPGLSNLTLADRATIANMAPEYGATCGLFPIDGETLRYLEFTGRNQEQIDLVEAYAKAQGFWHTPDSPEAAYTDTLELDLSTVVPSLAGPKRPQDRVPLTEVKANFRKEAATFPGNGTSADPAHLSNGSVVIAAITSCTNTSNPAVLLAAGLVAKKAVEKGLKSKPWVKTSLAPGSQVVTEYLNKAGLMEPLEALGFHVVGYGCTTCIGNSGPLPTEVSKDIQEKDLVVASVLSGNRNFEGRVHPEVKMNYLASPPLVVAYSLAGSIDVDLATEALGTGKDGKPVYLKDVWPTNQEVQEAILNAVEARMFCEVYANVFKGDEQWASLDVPEGDLYQWDAASTYVKHPPYFEGMGAKPAPVKDITGARVLALLGDSVTTDHISPAGNIKADSPAGKYLQERGVAPVDFNSYGSRRGNDEIMVRGTFANIRLKNKLANGKEGGFTRHLPDGTPTTIFDAAMQYKAEGVPVIILAGQEYGTGSSRDWAAKGPYLQGVRAVIAESFERIHRSNLIGMGILPLQFKAGESAASLGLTGEELYSIQGANGGTAKEVTVKAEALGKPALTFKASVRLDTPNEVAYFQHGGILQFVLRQLMAKAK